MKPPTRYLLLAALFDELKTTLRRLKLAASGDVYHGHHDQTRIVAAVMGLGAERALAMTNRLLDDHHPQEVILVGFAGGLDPNLGSGTCLNIHWVINEEGATIHLDPNNSPSHRAATPQIVGPNPTRQACHSLLTTDRFIRTAADKHDCWNRWHCQAVDMETYPIAELLARRGVPMTVRRVIHDSATMALPRQVVHWVRPDGQTHTAAVIRHLIGHPWRVFPLVQMGRLARRGAGRIADEVESLVRKSPG